MTSNIGAEKITHQATFGFEKRDDDLGYEKMRDMLKLELENYFRPEFLNRVDEVVVFHKLNHEDLTRIVELELRKVARRVEKHGLVLELDDDAKDFLLEKGTDEKFGARPLRRAIEHLVEDPLSENLLRGQYKDKNKVLVSVEGEDDEKKLHFEALEVPKEDAEETQLAEAGAGSSEAT
jgi:ATP-dependent Clp protease ATP-binding subunit ClpC